MCGRYALNLSPSQVRDMLMHDHIDVDNLPQDDGPEAPRQSYNFAPGYHGLVYRADTPDWGAGPRHGEPADRQDTGDAAAVKTSSSHSTQDERASYKLQSMKWGLIPFWTKRNPDYSSMMKTINCRDDSLSAGGGMWNTMKNRKRCIVIAEGFYEWLKTGPKDKLPHHVKRKDGHLMCFAGLWDCVQYEGSEDKTYTYTIITTDSNQQLKFLHDRMPVIMDPWSDNLKTWVDPARHEWSRELQSLLKPYDGELEVYPVSKEVGKVGNNSPSFVIPINSKENKSNIANFFAGAATQPNVAKKESALQEKPPSSHQEGEAQESKAADTSELEPEAAASGNPSGSLKRKVPEPVTREDPPPKKKMAAHAPLGSQKTSATQNSSKSRAKAVKPGTQKITRFFNSA